MNQLSDILAESAARWGQRLAVADAAGSLSYAGLLDQASRVAGWLIKNGVRPGDRVTLQLANGTRFVTAHFGVLLAGGVSTPLDPALPEPQLKDIISRTEPRVELNAESPWEEALGASPLPAAVKRAPGDLATLMFTTGTTGRPKGVMLTHANVLAALRNIVKFIGYTESDREVITLPLSHNFGLGHLYCNLMCGGAVYLENGLARVGRVLKAIEAFGATGFPTTPTGVAMLLDRYGEVFRERGSKLRFMVVNSAPLPPERAAQLQGLLPQLDILVYYGLTEASRSTFISLSKSGPSRYASVGPAMPGVDLRIDATGEVRISGPTVSPGYWREEELTARSFDGGALRTGDLGRLDDQGFLYLTGRADDIINLGGYKVNPADVERVVDRFPDVRESAVAGEGEVIVYYVSDALPDEDALLRHCRAFLQSHETPTRFVRVETLPRTDSGKLKRKALLLARPAPEVKD